MGFSQWRNIKTHVNNLEETEEKLPDRERDLRYRRPRDKLRETRLRIGDLDLNTHTQDQCWPNGTNSNHNLCASSEEYSFIKVHTLHDAGLTAFHYYKMHAESFITHQHTEAQRWEFCTYVCQSYFLL